MKDATYAPVYCALYPELAKIARMHGYALAVHGTLGRDMDLICIPWREEIDDPDMVVNDMTHHFSLKKVGGPPSLKNHGRIAYTLSVGFGECFIDLSFTPSSNPQLSQEN